MHVLILFCYILQGAQYRSPGLSLCSFSLVFSPANHSSLGVPDPLVHLNSGNSLGSLWSPSLLWAESYSPPKCWSPNPQHLSMWLYFKIGSWNGNQVKIRLLGWDLIQYNRHPYKKRKFGSRHRERQSDVETQGERHLPVEECLRLPKAKRDMERFLPRNPRKEPTLPTLWFWTSRL